jgi:uncharacterized cupin superfamily protein
MEPFAKFPGINEKSITYMQTTAHNWLIYGGASEFCKFLNGKIIK